MQDTDIVVIGAGVAGLTAAMTAAGHGLRTLVLEQLAPGGQVASVEAIRNFPGFPDGIAGFEIGPLLQQQAEAAGAAVQLDSVSAVERSGDAFRLICDGGATMTARTVIVAVGSALRRLEVPGETELLGRGVSHCAACDGPLFKGQPVVVAGGGDSAFDEALTLAAHAGSVTLVHRGPAPRARAPVVDRLQALPNVRVVPDAEIVAIHGTTAVTGVDIRSGRDISRTACAAVFGYVGLRPRTEWLQGVVALDGDGRIVTDPALQASQPGLFAAGDVRAGSASLLAEAAGDGARAAISAAGYLRRLAAGGGRHE